MVAVRLVAVKLVVVLTISVKATEKSEAVDDCHFTILPVWPLKVNPVLLVPVQTVALPAILPPALAGSTVTVPVAELAVAQTPDCTTAL